MDKKRRDTLVPALLNSIDECKNFWLSLLSPTETKNICGILHKRYTFKPNYGIGHFEFYSLDGLYISITDVTLKQDISVSGTHTNNALELSFLLEGEIIITNNKTLDRLIYEDQECYLSYCSNYSGQLYYYKNKPLKEIKITLSPEFINKNKLNETNILSNGYTPSKRENFSNPICIKTRGIISEILLDKRQGLLKRLFLQSKVLELLTIQLDTKQKPLIDLYDSNPKSIKKIYEIQHIINSNLAKQYSIQQLSRKVALNDFFVKREFKRIFGVTIFEYALSERMALAKKLLLHSKKPIYEISEMVGYKNATHFTAAFKKIEQITPKKFRNTAIK